MELINKNRSILFSILILLILTILTALATPLIIEKYTTDWKTVSQKKISQIETGTIEIFNEYQKNLIEKLAEFKADFGKIKIENDSDIVVAMGLIEDVKYSQYLYQIYNKDDKLIAWSSSGNLSGNFYSNNLFKKNECFFYQGDLVVFYTAYDTLGDYKIYIGLPFEKGYSLSSKYYKPISISDRLSKEFNTRVLVEFVSTKEAERDGRKYAFPVYNSFNNTIAYVTVDRPSRIAYINSIRETFTRIESYFIIAVMLLVGLFVYKNKNLFLLRTFKFIVSSTYLLLFRIVLFLFGIPSKIVETDLSNPEYFSSEFAFGMVKSPLEFFVTSLIIILILFNALKYIIQYLKDNRELKFKRWVYFIICPFLLLSFVLILRGFGASIRSIIFESTLRYFKYPSLLPDLPTLLMDFNILILGISSVLILVFISILFVSFWEKLFNSGRTKAFFITFFLFQLMALVFDLFQKQPQGTPLLRIISILIIFIFVYHLLDKKSVSATFTVSILFLTSLITISYLTYYNSDYEKKSLLTTAYQFVKPEEEYIEQLVKTTVENEEFQNKIINHLSNNDKKNYNAIAFQLWSNSQFEKENISSLVNIIGRDKMLLGKYGYQFYENYMWDWSEPGDSLTKLRITNTFITYSPNKIIRAIQPLYKKNILLGYLEVSVLLDMYSLGFEENPDFFTSSKALEDSPVNIKQLKIFDFQNNELVNYYTDLILSKHETNVILNAQFNLRNEAWLNIPLNNIEHIVYVKKIKNDFKNRIIAVALAEKDLSWSLFDFFKIFLVHSIFILTGLFIGYIFYFRKIFQLRYSFRTQLLVAFIFISTLPLVLLAFYFRNLTEEKNTAAIYYKLGKRADNVEEFLTEYALSDSSISYTTLEKATRDLGINFDLYTDKNLIFSSEQIYYDIGLISPILNAKVYKNFVLTGLSEYVVDEQIENYEYHSFYHKAKIGGRNYLIKVSDVFNSIQLPMSALEVDIFLFGSYSFAILLIIIFSTILANQISYPIRKLTNATKAVAAGNLNISVDENIRGEISELVDGFNIMVKELDKNQKELAEMEREAAWRDMAKQVAHEIKNPLTPMKLAVQQLIAAKQDNSPKYEDIFNKVTDTVIKQIDILKNIASEFSNFAKMPDLKKEKVNLVDTINNVTNLYSDGRIEIIHILEKNNCLVEADSEQLQRTLVNLIRNSIQASADKVYFIINSNPEYIMLKVKDNGQGIPGNIKHRIFDANFTTKIEGMGLGLHMAKRFFDLIGAELSIEETSSQGTTLIIKFPVKN